VTKASDNINDQEDHESIQETKNNFWYSIALLVGNIGIIVKVIVELILDRSKSE
jgi:hypothetical protein